MVNIYNYIFISLILLVPFFLVFYFQFSIHFMKRPGAVLEAGSILARLELDDPSQMKRVRLK